MRKVWLGGALLSLGLASGGVADARMTEHAPGVTGDVDDFQEGVVAVVLVFEDHYKICSGVVIDEYTVVTAGHCGRSSGVPARWYIDSSSIVRLEPAEDDQVEVIHGVTHPLFASEDREHVYDIAFLLLDTPAPTPSLPIAELTTNEPDGRQISVVGYGALSADLDGLGTRRTALANWTDLTSTHVHFGETAHACVGDSGGANILAGELVSITTHGDEACGQWNAGLRLDVHRKFREAFIGGLQPGGPCARDGQCHDSVNSCALGDPDCACPLDGTCSGGCLGRDPDCNEQCRADGQCVPECGLFDRDCCGLYAACADLVLTAADTEPKGCSTRGGPIGIGLAFVILVAVRPRARRAERRGRRQSRSSAPERVLQREA